MRTLEEIELQIHPEFRQEFRRLVLTGETSARLELYLRNAPEADAACDEALDLVCSTIQRAFDETREIVHSIDWSKTYDPYELRLQKKYAELRDRAKRSCPSCSQTQCDCPKNVARTTPGYCGPWRLKRFDLATGKWVWFFQTYHAPLHNVWLPNRYPKKQWGEIHKIWLGFSLGKRQ